MQAIRWENAERRFRKTRGLKRGECRARAPENMRRDIIGISVVAVAGALALATTAVSAQGVNWDKVDAALGRKAAVSGDVHRYGFPRTDLTVTLDGVTIKP